MDPNDAKQRIAQRVNVTPADINAAKAYLLTLGNGQISIKPQSIEWAMKYCSPGTPTTLDLDAEDVEEQIAKVARYITARLALCSAAWTLVRAGVFFQVGSSACEEFGWQWKTSGEQNSLNWGEQFSLLFPENIRRPVWHSGASDLSDADLYLQRLSSLRIHVNVEQALRLSLVCFQKELWIPAVAMLGAASEGAWIELGQALAAKFSTDPEASKLATALGSAGESTWKKINLTCKFYERPVCASLYPLSGVKPPKLRQAQQWADQIRESRNVLHWGAQPSVPNSYEKVAILLMDAVTELSTLYQIRNVC